MREIELDMPSLLLGPFLIEAAAREEHRLAPDCRASGRARGNLGSASPMAAADLRRRALVQLLRKRLQHARGVLAARRAEIEPRLLARGDRIRIVVAIVTALAAILLRHRRHHAPAQRAAFRQRHARVERQRLIVPRRFAIVASPPPMNGGVLLGRKRRDRPPSGATKPGEKAVEPGALLGREGRGFGQKIELAAPV